MEILNNHESNKIIAISFKDLTAVALLYNYLANNKTSLFTANICNFYNYIEKCKYSNQNTFYKFVREDDEPDNMLEKSIGGDPLQGIAEALNLEYLMRYYQMLPEEVIDKTLTEDALRLIRVDKKNLTLKNTTVDYYDSIKVYAMGARDAIEKSRKCLETYGYKNIRITSSFYLGMKDDHLYRVSYRANKYFESLDEEKTKIKVLGKNFKDIQ